jgi:hypothetical protein
MHVQGLESVVYADDGWAHRSEKIGRPSWEQIEAAIRRLNRFQYPAVLLWPTEDESEHAVDGDHECFEIMGGEGGYWLAGSIGSYYQRRYLDPVGGDDEVDVWTSDQGFADAERHICRELETVLQAARYYATHGAFDPALQWEDDGV